MRPVFFRFALLTIFPKKINMHSRKEKQRRNVMEGTGSQIFKCLSCNPGYLVGWWSVSLLDFCNSVACISFSVCSEDMANIVVNTEDQAEVVDEVL